MNTPTYVVNDTTPNPRYHGVLATYVGEAYGSGRRRYIDVRLATGALGGLLVETFDAKYLTPLDEIERQDAA